MRVYGRLRLRKRPETFTDVSGKGNFKAVPNKDKDINSETRYIAYVFISLLIRSAIRIAQLLSD